MNQTRRVLLYSLIAMGPPACLAQQAGVTGKNAASTMRDIQFRSGDLTLSGTLVVPSNMVADVVFVHGAGQERRNLGFAEALARVGVGTLTYDKRGVGRSEGVYAGPEVGTNNVDPQNLNLLAQDASAAIRDLVREISSPRTPVGLLGVSQAGWIIPLVASRNPDVKFMILWSGPLVTTLEQLRFQFLTDGEAGFWDHHTEAEVREHVRSDPDRYKFTPTDPVDSLCKLSIPGLWLYGGRDVSVPVKISIERLSASASHGKAFDYHVFPTAGHELPFGPALSVSIDWLRKTVAEARHDKPRGIRGS